MQNVALRKSDKSLKRDYKNRSYLFTFSKLGIEKKLISSEHNRVFTLQDYMKTQTNFYVVK